MKKYYLLLIAAIACEVFGTTMLKVADGFTRLLPTVLFAVGYLVCFICLTLALKGLPLGLAYGIWAGVGVAAVSIVGAVVWGDPLNFVMIAGIALVIVGVMLLESSADHGGASDGEPCSVRDAC